MSCQICGRRSAPGAKLCPDCRAARKRAYDATITQPLLAMAGAGTVSRTLSRLRRSDSSPEAKARRAARKAKAAADAASPSASVSQTAAAPPRFSRTVVLWAFLAVSVVVAAIAGWHLPTRAPEVDAGASSSAIPAVPPQPAPDAESARIGPPPTSPPAALPPLPTIVERELVPYSPAGGKPVAPRRASPAPKVVAQPPEAPAEVEIVKEPPAPAPAAPAAPVRVDPWQQMSEAIGRCPAGFLGRVVCEQKIRLQYCEGQWGKVPQCPGGPSADHN
jgi:hypothetical protein